MRLALALWCMSAAWAADEPLRLVNAADHTGGKVSPGEIVVLYPSNVGPAALAGAQLDEAGKVTTLLGDTRVWFDGEVTDATAYRQACRDLLSGPERPHLAIVLVSEQQRHLTGNDSPYLVAKSMLMSEGIPIQVFRLEKMARPDLAHLLNTMSVACYAKLEGGRFGRRHP